jgi:undecaprenyl pyrophosphate synthase
VSSKGDHPKILVPTMMSDAHRVAPTAPTQVLAGIPVYGDMSRLGEVLGNLDSLGLNTVVVNDGNGDALTRHLQGQAAEVVDLGANRGVGVATRTALGVARQRGYRGLVAVDADGAHDALSIQLLLATAMAQPDEAVVTCRFGQLRNRFIPTTKLAANKLASAVFSAVTGLPMIADVACGLRYYPSRLAAEHWSEDGFGFLYESLEAIRLGPHNTVDIWVDYPAVGPHLTADRELCHLMSWAESHAKGEIRKSLRSLIEELDHVKRRYAKSVLATFEGLRFTLNFVPSRAAWLITQLDPDAYQSKFLDLPESTKLAIGIIPDGGRRWAKQHRVSLDESYTRTIRTLVTFLEAQRARVSCAAVYWLSGANLLRSASEVEASLRAAHLFVDLLTHASFSPIILGDIFRLPPRVRNWVRDTNIRAAVERRPPVWIALGYTPSWQDAAFRPPLHPRELGLSPELAASISNLRLAAIFRSGGASTLSDFLPMASSYALLTFEESLFNDCDLNRWIVGILNQLPHVSYGT